MQKKLFCLAAGASAAPAEKIDFYGHFLSPPDIFYEYSTGSLNFAQI